MGFMAAGVLLLLVDADELIFYVKKPWLCWNGLF
jgi:hypothetical protein